VRKPTAAARQGTNPAQLAAPAGRRKPPRVREGGHPPGTPLKPSKITVKAVSDRRPTRSLSRSPGGRTREDDLDGDLASVRIRASRKDCQDWTLRFQVQQEGAAVGGRSAGQVMAHE